MRRTGIAIHRQTTSTGSLLTPRAVLVSLIILLSACIVPQHRVGEPKNIPSTLEDALAILDLILSESDLARIDAMPSEEGMFEYHFSLGMWIRNEWGFWRGSPLAEYLAGFGFVEPDSMSGIVLAAFWCHRHHVTFDLKQRSALHRARLRELRELLERLDQMRETEVPDPSDDVSPETVDGSER